MIFDRWDLIIVPHPFVELVGEKLRPALVLTAQKFHARNNVVVVAMITTARQMSDIQHDDVQIADFEVAGLKRPCVVRLTRVASLRIGLARGKIGRLSDRDCKGVREKFKSVFGL